MRKLTSLTDTARSILVPLRREFERTNMLMAEYEQDIATKSMKLKARNARLKLKAAVKEYNTEIEQILNT